MEAVKNINSVADDKTATIAVPELVERSFMIITGFHSIEEKIRSLKEGVEPKFKLYYSKPGPRVKKILEAAKKAKVTIVEKCFHKFSPYGVSGVVVIAESHLAIHTWPEHNYAAVDFFTCNKNCNVEIAIECIL